MTTANETMDLRELALGAKFLQAYLECSDEIQEGIREMLPVVFDPGSDADDRQLAMHSLADALYPHLHDGQLGLDLEQSEAMGAQHCEHTREAIEAMDQEEAVFAARLADLMQKRELTQVQLAKISGVGQPAISNMLKRQCRPQRRTILRFAEALSVEPQELWPGFESQQANRSRN